MKTLSFGLSYPKFGEMMRNLFEAISYENHFGNFGELVTLP